ncbi:beta-L-arabinofuranosidase domain-containing protein [Marispirochaeta aestuarii]|uniref:glycoside hydrolase family 127 protein n=1 Tax=Marispirochaeta aestuarii TaxID=1963862 RepID=UPI0029C66BFB|nr:beta-L-arabinofuranosidase domain-containing protein [Marispirochaeta aestuarii]
MQKGYRPLGHDRVEITDPLFRHYVDMIAEKVLPYQWDILNDRIQGTERSHCLANFRIAAGEMDGEFYGAVFQDSDVYKWLEAVSYSIESGKGSAFVPLAEQAIDLITRAQQPDGYLNTYYTLVKPRERWSNLREGHELYCAGYLIEAAVAYFNATGSKKLLNAAIRFADLIAATFGPGENQLHGYPGHQEIELALIRLYRVTQDPRYLETARYFIHQRGREPNYFIQEMNQIQNTGIFPELDDFDLKYAQAHIPPVEQRSIEGHAVRAIYMCAAMADLALECDDAKLAEASQALWKSVTEKKMFITGGIGSSGFLERFTTDYDLPNGSAYCETCASVGLMMFGQRMAALNKDASFYDTVEKALCNTVLAGISADGLRYFYVNPLEVWPDICLPHTSMAHVKPVRQQWFSVACCPTNVARTLASLGQYIYAEDEGALCIHQFISSRAEHQGRQGPVRISMEADIVRRGTVRISSDGPVNLCIRVPSWADHPVFQVDGSAFEPEIRNSYACIDLVAAGEILIDLHVSPRWVAASDSVRENAGKTALMLGPFVYCLEEADNGDNLPALVLALDAGVRRGESLDCLPGDMPKLEYPGFRFSSGVGSLYGSPNFTLGETSITAVPYCLWCNRAPGEMLVWQKQRL